MRKARKILSIIVTLATIIWSFSPASFIAGVAEAAVVQTTGATELITSGQKIKASSNFVALFGFGLNQNAGETLSSVELQINQAAGTVASSDFAGVYIFADNGATDDQLDGTDTLVGTQTTVNVGAPTTINTGAAAIPTTIAGSYYFLAAVKTSATAANGDSFNASVAGGIATYILSAGTVNATALTPANALTVDTVLPTATASGGPGDGQIGPPIDAMIDRQFSENLASSAITTANVKLQANAGNVLGGNPSASPNLCTLAQLQNSNRIICQHASLATGTWYTFTVTTGVTDAAGNALASNYTSQFQTSSFAGGDQFNPPPFVLNTVPAGGTTLPINGKFIIEFNRAMKITGDGSVLNVSNVNLFLTALGAPTGSNLFTATTGWTTENSTARLVIPVSGLSLTVGSYYRLVIKGYQGFNPQTWNPSSPSCGGVGESACVLSNDGLPMPGMDFILDFRAAATDATGPSIVGSYPASGATGIDRASYDFALSFNEALLSSTVSSTTVKFYCNDTDSNASNGCDDTDSAVDGTDPEITGISVKLDSDGRVIHLSPNAILGNNGAPTDNFLIKIFSGESGVKDVVGNAMASDSVRAFSASDNVNGQGAATYDNTSPTVLSANADNFGISVTFSEAMRFNKTSSDSRTSSSGTNDVNNFSSWTVQTSSDGTNWTGVNLSGRAVSYEAHTKTLMIDGLAMPPSQQVKVTASSSIFDLTGNGVGTPNTAQATVQNSNETGGQLGPGGQAGGSNYFEMGTRPISVAPKSALAGMTTRYRAEFPANTVITASGKITLSYPTGFSFASVCATWPTDTFENADINGTSTGAVAVASIVCDSVSRVATITLGGVGTQAGDMLRFEIQGVVNSTVPKDFSTSGYTVDIKTYNALNVLLESKTSMPFFIALPGTNTISGKIFVDADSDGVLDVGESGVDGTVNAIRVCAGGPMGFDCKTINATGNYSFTQLPNSSYRLDIPPISSGNYTGGPFSRDVNVTGGQTLTENFPLRTVLAANVLDVYVAGTGLTGTKLDVFAFSSSTGMATGPGAGMGGSVVRECTIGTDCDTVQLPLSQGRWQVGVGPWMPKEPGSTPSLPDFNFMPPRPVDVEVGASGVPDLCTVGAGAAKEICFTLTASANQIKGKVVDGSGNAISNAFVMARPAFMDISSGSGAGGVAQSDTNGLFSVKVVTGTYIVESSMPGMPPSNSFECTVRNNTVDESAAPNNGQANSTADIYCNGILMVNNATGFTGSQVTMSTVNTNDLVLTIAKGDTSISGRVLDDAGNPIAFAHVSGMEVDSSGNPLGGWADSPTDNSGNYTLFVNGGTGGTTKKWEIRAFAPGFGELPSITVSVSQSQNLTGKNLQVATTDFGTVSGTVTQNSVAAEGVFVSIHGSSGNNSTVTGSDGTYSLKTRAGSGYIIEGFMSGQGPTSKLTSVTVTASATLAGQNLTMAQPGTIVVYVCTLDNPSAAPTATNNCNTRTISTAYVDARDSSGQGNGTSSNTTAGQYEVVVPAGAYTVKASEPTVGLIGSQSSVTVTGGAITYVNIAPAALYQISGTVTSTESACLEGATVALSEKNNGRMILAQVAAAGTWSVSNAPNGSYSVIAGKPGCVDGADVGLVSVSGANATAAARTLVKADATISGRVTLDSSNVTFETMVFATLSGKVVVANVDTSQTGTSNNYSLALTAGTWSVRARTDGYESTAASVTVASGGSGTQDITLSAIAGYTRREPKPYGVKPSRGGIVKNDEISSDFEVNIPAGAMGSSSNDGSVLTKETTAVADTGTQDVLGNKGIEVTPKDASGQPITTVSSSSGGTPTITISYNPTDLPSGSGEEDIVIAAWSDEKQQWDSLPTTCDTTNNKCTATIEHFSTFAPVVATGGGAPSTPSGLAATAASTSQINLSWTAVGGATSYDIYRDTSPTGSFARIGSEPTVSSGSTTNYSDTTGLSSGTTYYYKISALNASGESAASSAIWATTLSGGGGGGGGDTTPPTSTSASISAGVSETTSRTITLTLGASGATEMAVSNSVDFTGVSWQTYATSLEWELSDDYGEKTVYIKFRDAVGNVSGVISDTINYVSSTAAPATSAPTSTPTQTPTPAATLEEMSTDASAVVSGDVNQLLSLRDLTRNTAQESQNLTQVTKILYAGKTPTNAALANEIVYFVAYGTPTTKILGSGERLGVVNSFKAAFGRLPDSVLDWNDVIKIANGRWPSQRSTTVENRAKLSFKAIYLRNANMANPNDNAAITVMAYGLRPAQRNLASERAAIISYKAVFTRSPATATAWDAVRAISYSGAKR